MIEKSFPDGYTKQFSSEDDYLSQLNKWLKQHPTWKQSEFGVWYDEEDNERFKDNFNL